MSYVLLKAGKIENLDQAALGFIQPDLDNFQKWKLHSLSMQPTLVLNYLMIYFFPLGIGISVFQFMSVNSHSSNMHLLLGATKATSSVG